LGVPLLPERWPTKRRLLLTEECPFNRTFGSRSTRFVWPRSYAPEPHPTGRVGRSRTLHLLILENS
jgi:hypothetical protein